MYQLIDFGKGRKLERIADRLLNRPCPAADRTRRSLRVWPDSGVATFSVGEHTGTWKCPAGFPDVWEFPVWFGSLKLSLSPFGHIGVFPEQQENWNWLKSLDGRLGNIRLLNLFAYTGGSTMAALSVGAQVTHVDSAKNIVTRARGNVTDSDLADRPVRWIVEDVMRFVQREIRRGNRYDGVILDPPSFGRGVSKGQHWDIERDLPELLGSLRQLIPDCQLLLCTCHSPGISPQALRDSLSGNFAVPENCHTGEMTLMTNQGKRLTSGVCVRWFRSSKDSG